jgi:hypothetical protein
LIGVVVEQCARCNRAGTCLLLKRILSCAEDCPGARGPSPSSSSKISGVDLFRGCRGSVGRPCRCGGACLKEPGRSW